MTGFITFSETNGDGTKTVSITAAENMARSSRQRTYRIQHASNGAHATLNVIQRECDAVVDILGVTNDADGFTSSELLEELPTENATLYLVGRSNSIGLVMDINSIYNGQVNPINQRLTLRVKPQDGPVATLPLGTDEWTYDYGRIGMYEFCITFSYTAATTDKLLFIMSGVHGEDVDSFEIKKHRNEIIS